MSVGPESQVDLNLIEQTRKHINRLIEEIARLSEQDLGPADYYKEFLERIQRALAATAGAVWAITPQGHLQLQFQINLRQVGLDQTDQARQQHGELLRHAVTKGEPMLMLPHSGVTAGGDGTGGGNPTDYMVLMAPIVIDKQVAGLIEVFQDANRNPNAHNGYLQFLIVVANLAARFMRNQRMRQMSGQQQVWSQLEAFARQVHGSLHPTEVSYLVANEGNRLVGCDRLSVAQRRGNKTVIEAVSGADVVERRSKLIQLMRKLCDSVLKWDEKLVYAGTRDDSLPPDVLKALDDFLAESNSKLLVVLPVRDEREKDNHKPCRSALLMECFEPNQSAEQLVSRLDVVGKHSVSALYNALEHRRIPMRWIWQPLAKLQEGLGGKTRAIITAVVVALALIIFAMVTVPYPLKMDAKGQLLPQERVYVYSPVPGHILQFEVEPNMEVSKDQNLVVMYDVELQTKLTELRQKVFGLQTEIRGLSAQLQNSKPEEKAKISADIQNKNSQRELYYRQYVSLRDRANADERVAGNYWLKSPIDGIVLSYDFRENLTNKYVKPSEQILRIGDHRGPWEVELKVPQKHVGQVRQAFKRADGKGIDMAKELEVDVLLMTDPTQIFKGKLRYDQIGGEAVPNRDDNNESEPVVLVRVRISGDDIPAGDQIPREKLLAGAEVHAKVRCGNHRMGYSLFYGIWEFFYEKVVFFF